MTAVGGRRSDFIIDPTTNPRETGGHGHDRRTNRERPFISSPARSEAGLISDAEKPPRLRGPFLLPIDAKEKRAYNISTKIWRWHSWKSL